MLIKFLRANAFEVILITKDFMSSAQGLPVYFTVIRQNTINSRNDEIRMRPSSVAIVRQQRMILSISIFRFLKKKTNNFATFVQVELFFNTILEDRRNDFEFNEF